MWTRKLSIEHLELFGKRVLIRADCNVPIHNGKVINNKKIIDGLDSIVYALAKGAQSVIIISHLGKPKGIKNMRYSLKPVAEELELLLQQVHKDPHSLGKYSKEFEKYSTSDILPQVRFFSNCVGSEIDKACLYPPKGSIYLLENLRFHVEEQGCGEDTSGNVIIANYEATRTFRKSLRMLGDVYVNDAFSQTHKTDSSILAEGFEKRAAGLLLAKEVGYLTKVIYKPDRPLLAIFGGINITDKVYMIDRLLDKVTEMIIAGAMAFPFLKKLKYMHTGHSLFDMEGYNMVKNIMKKAKQKRVKIHFPTDFLAGSRFGAIEIETIRSGIENEWMGLDIGPETCNIFRKIIMKAKMIIWNGPPGAYELDLFRKGTHSMLLDVVKATSRGTTSILVGQDTAACAAMWNQEDKVSHISGGNTAAKVVLQGNILPGVNSLSDR